MRGPSSGVAAADEPSRPTVVRLRHSELAVPSAFAGLDPDTARKLTLLFHKASFPVRRVSEVYELPSGVLRLKLEGMVKAPRHPDGWLLHGMHATSTAGALGILTDGRIRAGREWQVLFFHARRNTRSTSDLVELFAKSRAMGVNECDAIFEFSLRQPFERVEYGGHEAEVAACQRSGACFYACSDTKRRRWTARDDVVQVEALWCVPGPKLLHDIDSVAHFRLPA
jgi:hypothetical protein